MVQKNYFAKLQSYVQFTPEVGNFYLFPNYLMHTVYPFTRYFDEERRSVSFNAKIDDDAARLR